MADAQNLSPIFGWIPQPIVEGHFPTPVIIAASTKTHLNYSAAWSQRNKSHRRKHKGYCYNSQLFTTEYSRENHTHMTPLLHYRLEILKGTVHPELTILSLLQETKHSSIHQLFCIPQKKYIYIGLLIFTYWWINPSNAWYTATFQK